MAFVFARMRNAGRSLCENRDAIEMAAAVIGVIGSEFMSSENLNLAGKSTSVESFG